MKCASGAISLGRRAPRSCAGLLRVRVRVRVRVGVGLGLGLGVGVGLGPTLPLTLILTLTLTLIRGPDLGHEGGEPAEVLGLG